jgi:hypothetical protein
MGALAGQASVKLAVVLVSGSIGSLKLAVMSVLIATPVAFASGAVELTVGAVVSGATPVVKVQVKALASALPATSLTSVVIRAAQVVLAGRSLAGVKVAILPLHDAVDFPHHLPRTVDITTKADHVYFSSPSSTSMSSSRGGFAMISLYCARVMPGSFCREATMLQMVGSSWLTPDRRHRAHLNAMLDCPERDVGSDAHMRKIRGLGVESRADLRLFYAGR